MVVWASCDSLCGAIDESLMRRVLLRRHTYVFGRSRGLTYGVTSLEGEGLPVRPTLRVQSYLTTHPGEGLPVHLVPARLVPPVPEHLVCADLLLGERVPFGEAPVLEGVAVLEVPLVAASFS